MYDYEKESEEINFKRDVKKLRIPENLGADSASEESTIEFIVIVE